VANTEDEYMFAQNKGMLGTSLRDTYVMYPYQESPKTRALSSQECPLYIWYLVTMRICM
jgi:hypothetical protein